MEARACEWCRQPFEAVNPARRYCGSTCRVRAHQARRDEARDRDRRDRDAKVRLLLREALGLLEQDGTTE